MKVFVVCAIVLVSSLATAQRRDQRRVNSIGLRSGDSIVTSEGYPGIVQGVFGDGRVSVRIGSTNYVYDRSNIATEGCNQGVCSGSPVVTTEGYRATVSGFFPSGDVSVKIGSTNYKYSFQNLAPEGCMSLFCTGDQVTTREGYSATVNGLFPDGRVSVRIGSTNYVYSQSSLAVTTRRPERPGRRPSLNIGRSLQTGDAVVTREGYAGSVNGVFSDRNVSVRIGSTSYQYDRSNLAVTGCSNGLCDSQRVTTNEGYSATVNGFFPSGEVSVKIGSSNYVYSASRLAW